MRILVIGAGGRTGRLIAEQALGHGHDVRAFVRSTRPDIKHPRLEIVEGDVLEFADVDAAMEGVDAVAFAVSSGGNKSAGSKDVRTFSEGIGNVLHAMAAHDVAGIVAISASGVFRRNDPAFSLAARTMMNTVLKSSYDDMERMEQRIAASGVAWTIVRPVGLSDGPQTGTYRLSLDGSLLKKTSRIARADVAALALKALETGAYERKTVVIAQ